MFPKMTEIFKKPVAHGIAKIDHYTVDKFAKAEYRRENRMTYC